MSADALSQARTMLNELTEAARAGQIIPVRLVGQLEAILQMVDQAQEEKNHPSAGGGSGDLDTYRTDLANFLSHGFHDLRLPLTNIRGYADMMATPGMGDLNDMQQQFVGTIRANSRRLESLLTDVSDMSKIRGGTLKINAKMDMFKNIAMMIEKQSRPTAEELSRKLDFDIPQGLPLLNIDSDMLTKAICKLVENSLRYTPEGGPPVTISAQGDGGKLHIQVRDGGIGMTPEELAKLGTPYFRGDSELVLSFKGSGLGIPVAYGIIQLLGGSVSVTSEAGQGTTFSVILPGMS